MSTMVEKLAMAIAENFVKQNNMLQICPRPEYQVCGIFDDYDNVFYDCEAAARAAIEAMMDPTDAMIMSQGKSKPENAATETQRERAEALNNSVRKLAVIQWQEMIRAALKEETP